MSVKLKSSGPHGILNLYYIRFQLWESYNVPDATDYYILQRTITTYYPSPYHYYYTYHPTLSATDYCAVYHAKTVKETKYNWNLHFYAIFICVKLFFFSVVFGVLYKKKTSSRFGLILKLNIEREREMYR